MIVRAMRAKPLAMITLVGLGVVGYAQAPTTAPAAPSATPAAAGPSPTESGAAAGGAAVASAPAVAAAPAVALDPEVDRILTTLEQRDVRDLRARLTWQQRYVLGEEDDTLTKRGEIWYQKGTPTGRFLIHFREKIVGGRKDALDERHLFDGCWYAELQSTTKTLVRREIRKPDDPTDPYKVGQGAFPLPFGQRKDDILREFAVVRVAAGEGDPPETDHLRLTPREGTETGRTYKELDFWVARGGAIAGLPVKVQVAKKDGTGKVNSLITIRFEDAQLDTGFSAGVFELKPPPGYEVFEEPLEREAPPPPGALPRR